MSKLGCACGHTISDQTDNIIYKAHFKRDQDQKIYSDQIEDIVSYIDSVRKGTEKEWIKNRFGEDASTDMKDIHAVCNILVNPSVEYESRMYLCEECGRVLIQKGVENRFLSFTPETEEWEDLFKGVSVDKDN